MASSHLAESTRGWPARGREHLAGADLHLAALSFAPFPGADLRRADLHEAWLRDSCLDATDLRGADLGGADLQGATFSPATAWPAGFDPLAAGARREARSLGAAPSYAAPTLLLDSTSLG